MSTQHIDATVAWGGARRGEIFSPRVELQTWSGERLDVVVDEGEACLVEVDGDVIAVALAGHHPCLVLRSDEDPGDVSAREFAGRMHIEIEDVESVRRRSRLLDGTGRLVFVAVGALAVTSFGQGQPVIFDDERRGTVALEVEGAARLRLDDPTRFHASFLRGCEELHEQDFQRIAGALVVAGLGRAFQARTRDVEALEPDRTAVASQAEETLRPELETLGLGVEALEITRLELPLGGPVERAPEADLAVPSSRG